MKWVAALVVCGCAGDATPSRVYADRSEVPPPPAAPTPAQTGGAWAPLTNPPSFQAALALLAHDGTVMVQEMSTEHWWQLTPDPTGSYRNGTWSQLASMPTGYTPLYYASGFLPDGRLVAIGGEYLNNSEAWTTKGAIYDPAANKWTQLAAPTGWTSVGDAQSAILPDGTFMLADCCTKNEAVLDAQTLSWKPTGTGKLDSNDEEGWTLLPDGTLFTIDANNTARPMASEIYAPATGAWTAGTDTAVELVDPADHEIGPAVLRPDGTVFAIGGTGHNAVYDSNAKTWTAAPDLPTIGGQPLVSEDGPAALLPNGNVLLAASPVGYTSPTHYFEWDGTAITEVPAPPGAPNDASYQINLLILPSGEIMATDMSTDVELYTPTLGPDLMLAPVVTTIPEEVTSATAMTKLRRVAEQPFGLVPLTTLYGGRTYIVTADRPNGVSQGSFYGDDAQASTNYPIVRLANLATGRVRFVRTHSSSTFAIGKTVSGTLQFDVPEGTDGGPTSLTIVTNGIPSPAITVEVK
jgi:hypothetical protein